MFVKELMNDILLDTNILLYAIDEESKYFKAVHSLINKASSNLYTTSKNLSEFLSVVTQVPKNCIPVKEALKVVNKFQNTFSILYPSEKSYSIFLELLEKYSPTGLKIHDYEIASIALANKIKNIATVNQKDFIDIAEIELISIL
jgi:predicted nucleic acid-binding protein